MPFFIRSKKSGGKPKSTKSSFKQKDGLKKKSDGDGAPNNRKRKLKASEGEVTSESEIESDIEDVDEAVDSHTSSEDETETVAEKRLRLAKEILAKIKEEEQRKQDEAEEGDDFVADRLKKDILEQTGKLRREVAQLCVAPIKEDVRVCTWRKLSVVTCVAVSPDDKFIFCGTKNGTIVKWSVLDCSKVGHIAAGVKSETDAKEKPAGHVGDVLALTVSHDNKFLVTGGRDKQIHVWSPDTLTLLHTFQGHKAAVTGLVIRKGSDQLYSASDDRSIKVWNLSEMGYVETLFGHEVGVTGIDCLMQERVISSGGRDGSVRLWKIIDESHLIFHGHSSSIDCVCYVDDQHFLSGAEDGSLALWGTMKKKPLVLIRNAHTPGKASNCQTTVADDQALSDQQAPVSTDPAVSVNGVGDRGVGEKGLRSSGEWITAVAALPYTDLLVSGSSDGLIRFWECGTDFRFLKPLFTLPVEGYVNSLRFSTDGRYLVAGVGREHRLGRWRPIKHCRDAVWLIPINRTQLPQLSNIQPQLNNNKKPQQQTTHKQSKQTRQPKTKQQRNKKMRR